MLQSVEWGSFRIGDLFDIHSSKKRFDANKVIVSDKGHPYVVRTSQNNGIKGCIEADESYLNDGNTISFGQDTATMYYQEQAYFTGDKIKILKPRDLRFKKKNAMFFIAAMQQAFASFSWGASSFNIKIIANEEISLPVREGEIDYAFMEEFIAKLNADRLAKLNAYLSVTGLQDYTLTPQEEQALQDFQAGMIEWREYSFETIFNHIEQGRRLKKDDQKEGNIPFVMSGVSNTGVVKYISNPIAVFPSNSITIDIFGNAFYRGYGFGAGDDTGVYWNDQADYSKNLMLFFTSTMARALVDKYSYGYKLRSSQSFKKKLSLIVNHGVPDYIFMESLISAVQKLVIKEVVQYADREIAATQQVISQSL